MNSAPLINNKPQHLEHKVMLKALMKWLKLEIEMAQY